MSTKQVFLTYEMQIQQNEKETTMQSPRYPDLPDNADVHYLIEDTLSALPRYLKQGYSIAIEPFSTDKGMCAVLQDERGTRLGILERPIESDQTIRH